MTDEKQVEETPFKLSIREEGIFVNCYVAPNPKIVSLTMDRYLIGSAHARTLRADPALFREWKEFMKRVLIVIARESIGMELKLEDMREEDAPEDERAPEGGH